MIFKVVLLVSTCFAALSFANLSIARYNPGATTLNELAFFAGGHAATSFDRVDIFNSTSLTWSNATLSEARTKIAAVSIGDVAIFAGGYNNSFVPSDKVDIFNYTSKTWSTARLSLPRYDIGATALGNLVFFAGGTAASPIFISDVIDIYNIQTKVWTTSKLSVARAGVSAVAIKGLALFVCGTLFGGRDSSTVDMYNSTSGVWSSDITQSVSGSSFSGAVIGNLALFAGGTAFSQAQDTVITYNYALNSWSTANLSVARYWLSAATVGLQVYFAGGLATNHTALSNVDVYDSITNTWSSATPLSTARFSMGATVVNNFATATLFLGGGGTYSSPSSAVDTYYGSRNNIVNYGYDPAATTLNELAFFAGGHAATSFDRVSIFNSTSLTWSNATLSEARTKIAAVSIGDVAIFAGGYNNSFSPSTAIDIYHYSTGTWTTYQLSVGRYDIGCATLGRYALFVGGIAANSEPVSNVDVYDSILGTWSSMTHPYTATPNKLAGVSFGGVVARFFYGSMLSVYVNTTGQFVWDLRGSYGLVGAVVGTSINELAVFVVNEGISVQIIGKGEQYNNITDTIGSVNTDTTAKAYWRASASQGKYILFAGGKDVVSGLPIKDVDIYDTTTSTWSKLYLSQARFSARATTVNGMTLIGGGNATSVEIIKLT